MLYLQQPAVDAVNGAVHPVEVCSIRAARYGKERWNVSAENMIVEIDRMGLTAWWLGLDRGSQYLRSICSNAVRWVVNCTSLVDERLVCCGLIHLQLRSVGVVSALRNMYDFESLLRLLQAAPVSAGGDCRNLPSRHQTGNLTSAGLWAAVISGRQLNHWEMPEEQRQVESASHPYHILLHSSSASGRRKGSTS